MSYTLTEIAGARNSKKALIFIRGFQGSSELRRLAANLIFSSPARRHQRAWYCGLREYGYPGRLLTFRWHCNWNECFSAARRSAKVHEAAIALCDLLSRRAEFDPQNTSVLGFSMGGWIIQRALRIARWNNVRIRRAYLLGAAAPPRVTLAGAARMRI
jgi:pimeloyl-ACP methyl ester carboxylesterase